MLKKNVLRKKSDFDTLYSKGKSAGDKYVVVFVKPNNLQFGRKAFLASKKVGGSVERNRARRLMKESFRALLPGDLVGYDIVVIARSTIKGTKEGEVEKSLKQALKKAGVLEKSK